MELLQRPAGRRRLLRRLRRATHLPALPQVGAVCGNSRRFRCGNGVMRNLDQPQNRRPNPRHPPTAKDPKYAYKTELAGRDHRRATPHPSSAQSTPT